MIPILVPLIYFTIGLIVGRIYYARNRAEWIDRKALTYGESVPQQYDLYQRPADTYEACLAIVFWLPIAVVWGLILAFKYSIGGKPWLKSKFEKGTHKEYNKTLQDAAIDRLERECEVGKYSPKNRALEGITAMDLYSRQQKIVHDAQQKYISDALLGHNATEIMDGNGRIVQRIHEDCYLCDHPELP